jgi:predicted  nucleic acid-binding Zn ribbon protein
MKKLMVCIATTVMLLTCTPIQAKAENNPIPISATDTEKESAELKALIKRVNEINAMDRSTMTRAERKEIRKELHAIKKEVKRHGGGTVYISGGLLVLILVLIILF